MSDALVERLESTSAARAKATARDDPANYLLVVARLSHEDASLMAEAAARNRVGQNIRFFRSSQAVKIATRGSSPATTVINVPSLADRTDRVFRRRYLVPNSTRRIYGDPYRLSHRCPDLLC